MDATMTHLIPTSLSPMLRRLHVPCYVAGWAGLAMNQICKFRSRPKRCAMRFGAGCTDYQAEISVLGLFCDRQLFGPCTLFTSNMPMCGLRHTGPGKCIPQGAPRVRWYDDTSHLYICPRWPRCLRPWYPYIYIYLYIYLYIYIYIIYISMV